MSQYDFGTIDPNTKSGTALATDLNSWRDALHSTHGGSSAPSYITAGMLWVDTTSANYELKMYDGAQSITVAVIDATNNVARVAVDSAETSYITSTTAGRIQHIISGSAKVTVNSTGVGIGTSSPAAELHVNSGAANLVGLFESTDAGATITLIDDATTGGSAAEHGLNTVGDELEIRAVEALAFETAATERMRIDASGEVGIGTDSPANLLHLKSTSAVLRIEDTDAAGAYSTISSLSSGSLQISADEGNTAASSSIRFDVDGTERARITSDGDFVVGKTAIDFATVGIEARPDGILSATRNGGNCINVNRLTSDGALINFQQAGTTEGSISVSGTTVSYNGGHLSRWAQFPDNSRPELLKGTVMSNLDQMSNWGEEDNEQLNCVQVSTVEGDPDVAGVFVAWDSTDDGYNDILLAMTGDMVIRIGAGVTVARGDLLMSAGDGTAKPQGDDIVRSKTIAKVTSTHVSHTYADGSYAVPCVLMAC